MAKRKCFNPVHLAIWPGRPNHKKAPCNCYKDAKNGPFRALHIGDKVRVLAVPGDLRHLGIEPGSAVVDGVYDWGRGLSWFQRWLRGFDKLGCVRIRFTRSKASMPQAPGWADRRHGWNTSFDMNEAGGSDRLIKLRAFKGNIKCPYQDRRKRAAWQSWIAYFLSMRKKPLIKDHPKLSTGVFETIATKAQYQTSCAGYIQ